METLVAVCIAGMMFLTLYAGFSSGFAILQLSRENLRGTQILQEKLETLRLYNWDQLTNSSFIPSSFVENFYPAGQTNVGISYTGTLAVASAPITESYSNDMRMITVNLQWTSAKILRKRDMTTFVSRYGLQNYIY